MAQAASASFPSGTLFAQSVSLDTGINSLDVDSFQYVHGLGTVANWMGYSSLEGLQAANRPPQSMLGPRDLSFTVSVLREISLR